MVLYELTRAGFLGAPACIWRCAGEEELVHSGVATRKVEEAFGTNLNYLFLQGAAAA
jgi:hypothetical protein